MLIARIILSSWARHTDPHCATLMDGENSRLPEQVSKSTELVGTTHCTMWLSIDSSLSQWAQSLNSSQCEHTVPQCTTLIHYVHHSTTLIHTVHHCAKVSTLVGEPGSILRCSTLEADSHSCSWCLQPNATLTFNLNLIKFKFNANGNWMWQKKRQHQLFN